jgi:hypothetical protein
VIQDSSQQEPVVSASASEASVSSRKRGAVTKHLTGPSSPTEREKPERTCDMGLVTTSR